MKRYLSDGYTGLVAAIALITFVDVAVSELLKLRLIVLFDTVGFILSREEIIWVKHRNYRKELS
jgi:hypothetical protein